MGGDWLSQIKLDWPRLNHVQGVSASQQILDKHEVIFKDELGTVQGVTAKFYIDLDAKPKFLKAHLVPYTLQSKVEVELNRLQAAGVMKPVKFSAFKKWTNQDPTLSRVRTMIQQGWQFTNDADFKPYREELSVHDGCVLWGS